MNHLIVDCTTGEETVIPWTAEEIAAHETHVASQAQEQPRDLHAELDALRADLETLKAERS